MLVCAVDPTYLCGTDAESGGANSLQDGPVSIHESFPASHSVERRFLRVVVPKVHAVVVDVVVNARSW